MNARPDYAQIPLTAEMIPHPTWGLNARKVLSKRQWAAVSGFVARRANFRCEKCGGRGRFHPVEAHEVWQFDDEHHVQRLTDVVALCPACHSVKHFGLAKVRGVDQEAFWHLVRVNGWAPPQVVEHLTDAEVTWQERSRHAWHVDMSYLNELLREIDALEP